MGTGCGVGPEIQNATNRRIVGETCGTTVAGWTIARGCRVAEESGSILGLGTFADEVGRGRDREEVRLPCGEENYHPGGPLNGGAHKRTVQWDGC